LGRWTRYQRLVGFLHHRPGSGGNVTLSFDNGTIVTSNTFLITTDTVIDASGRLNVAISGSGSTNRLFDVAAGVTFTINNVTLTGGKSFGNNGVSGANGPMIRTLAIPAPMAVTVPTVWEVPFAIWAPVF